ncbi:MAG: radical SAM protein [Candidatus Eisenbacteria bacterium]
MSRIGFYDPGAECRLVARRFEEARGQSADLAEPCAGRPAARPDVSCLPSRCADPGITPGNIVILLPFALAGAHPFADCLAAARTMALGNAFGAAHFLQQDRWLDGDESPTPAAARLSDDSFLRFVLEYSRLFPTGSAFWIHLERYLDEFFTSLEWESRVLMSDDGGSAVGEEALAETLTKLGRKMSPLKASAAGMALLAGRPDTLARAERIVEDYHAAYQLADDIEDLEPDLSARRWSAAAWLMATRSGLATPAEACGAGELLRLGARSGALDELVELVCSRYDRGAAGAALLGATILESHLRRSQDRARLVLGRMSRRLAIVERAGEAGSHARTDSGASPDPGPDRLDGNTTGRGRAPADGLHDFQVDDDVFVFDTRSGLFFEADGLASDVIRWLRAGESSAALDVLRMNHGPGPVGEALGEISVLTGGRRDALLCHGAHLEFTMDERHLSGADGPSLSGIASVALNVSGGCNLSCDYCYLGREPHTSRLMSDDVARAAIDLLLSESFGERSVSVVFFGGEPLLNPGLIERTARYARGRAATRGVDISFHMTTNGTLLTPDVAEMLHAVGVRILVSIDGPANSHDAHRPFPDGGGSYERIAANLRGLPEGMRPGARATVTEDSVALTDLVGHLVGLGFGVVHLAPVSGAPMTTEFADRLVGELDELARAELESIRAGRRPSAGCFIEPVLALELGRQRLAPCGAGARYVSVDHDGRLYLCHRFAGDARYAVGDVGGGLDRFAVGRLLGALGRRSAACADCWAFGLCGGACLHDVESAEGTFAGPTGPRCRVTQRILELSMWLYVSLPKKSRARLAEAARQAVRPEFDAGRESGGTRRDELGGVNMREGR